MVAYLFASSMCQPHYQKQTYVTSFISNTIGIAERNTDLLSPAIKSRRNVHTVVFCSSVAIRSTADESILFQTHASYLSAVSNSAVYGSNCLVFEPLFGVVKAYPVQDCSKIVNTHLEAQAGPYTHPADHKLKASMLPVASVWMP